ncbi:MAG: hypothetical protein KGJ86_04845 [Chloroflexota bacterium]|nr:hypothetical protein [Chloroflexota bacterium]
MSPASGRSRTVTLTTISNANQGLAEALRQAGYNVVETPSRPPRQPWSADEIAQLFAGADAIVATPTFYYPQELLRAARGLRLITSGVIGVDNIDVDAATELGIVVSNCPTQENIIGVAESTVMLMVALLLELASKQSTMRAGNWRPQINSHILWKKTVGLVGYGRIGRAVQARLQGWDVNVQFHDPYVPGSVGLEELLRTSDVVSLHVVLTPETRNMISARELALMKPSAVILNTSRGGAIDEAALAEAIDGGRLAGAAIDVFEQEPVNMDNPLFRCDPRKVILTPHAIGHNVETGPSGAKMALENVERVMRGELPESVINPSVVPAWRERLTALRAE